MGSWRTISVSQVLLPAAVAGLLAAGHAAAFPLIGAGDIHFRLDHASFRSGAGTTESEFYLEVDNAELGFRVKDGRLVANLEFHLEFLGGGKRIGGREYPLSSRGRPPVPRGSAGCGAAAGAAAPHPVPADSVAAGRKKRPQARLVYLF
jgi:hypothetical protein